MTLKAGVDVIGNTAPLIAALGDASKATVDYEGTTVDAFANMDRSALAYAASLDRLALATTKYGAGSLGAAEATLRHQRVVQSLASQHTSAMSTVGRNLTTYATLPVVAGIALATKEATNFQSAMLQIQTQAGASATEVKNMSAAILQFAQSGAQQGPTELAQGLFHLESVGLRGAAAMNALKVASNAAALGMAPLEDTASALAGAITSGIKGTKDYQQTMGVLNATIGAGNMHMEDLLGALSTGLLPKAKNAGLSLQEVGAALAVLTDRGMSAEQGATRLGQTFAFMEKQTPAATKALADMGVSASQMKDTIGGPNGLYNVLEMLAQGMQRVGAERGRTDILTAFGGGRSSGALLTLIQSLTSAMSSYQGKLKEISATSGKLATDEAAQQKTAAAQFHQDLSKMEADAVQLGDTLLPLATGAVNAITKIVGAFNDLPGPIKSDIEVIAGLLAVGGPMLLAVSTAKKMIQALGTAFETMGIRARAGAATADVSLTTLAATSTTTATAVEGDMAAIDTAEAGAGAGLMGILGPLGLTAGASYLLYQYASRGDSNPFSHKQHEANPAKGVPAGYNYGSPTGQIYDPSLGGGPQTTGVLPRSQVNKLVPLIEHGLLSTSNIEALKSRLSPTSYQSLLGLAKLYAPKLATFPEGREAGSASALAAAATKGGLSKAQALQLALDLHPDNLKLLAQEKAMDEHELTWLTRRFHAGKFGTGPGAAAKYLAEAGPLASAIAAISSRNTTATNKKTAAANKRKAAATKAQREHAAAITAQADQLKAAVGHVTQGGPRGGAHGLSKDQVDAYDTLIAFYNSESHDADLTATERARYADLATSARKQQIAESLKGAANYERIAVEDAKAAVALSKRIKGDRAGQEKALRNEIQVYYKASRNPMLAATKRATYRADEATAKEQLAGIRGTYAAPMSLQLAFAKATATGNMGDLYQTALEEKAAAEKAIKSGTEGMQGMIDAWNVIDTANQALLTDIMGASVAQSAQSFLRGLDLHGLTRAQKIAIEQGFAQSMAHAGHVPTGAGVQGVANVGTHVHINGPVHLHGVQNIDEIERGLQRKGLYRAVQTRGPNAGR